MIARISGAIPSAEGIVEGLKKSPADFVVTVPSILQQFSQSPKLLDYCAQNLKMIVNGGGDLPQEIGDIISPKIRLVNQFGSTKLGLTPHILPQTGPDVKDWKYIQFHPDLGHEYRHIQDSMYELYAVRDAEKEEQQPTFTIFPNMQEYGSRDLFIRHPEPEKSDLWCWHARANDIIVFLNGEKLDPLSIE